LQYCYFKKLHSAALLIQKHYRQYRAAKTCAMPARIDDDRLHTPTPADLQREHSAATTIQHAYRGHYMRKRQAAARKIQKFMRESRKK
jgi:hypothetical protein